MATIGVITKIHPVKRGGNGQNYIQVDFEMDNGAWAKTYICPDNGNCSSWNQFLQIGNRLKNLVMIDDKTVDADSRPILVARGVDPHPALPGF
jgi:hypothetical protein